MLIGLTVTEERQGRTVHFKDGSSHFYPYNKEFSDFLEASLPKSVKKSDFQVPLVRKIVNRKVVGVPDRCRGRLDVYSGEESDGDRSVRSVEGRFQEPVLDVSDSFLGELRRFGFDLVGHGSVTSADCNRYLWTLICARISLHPEHPGQIFTHKVHCHCNNWRCPKCFFYGAAVRSAGHIKQRIVRASELLGLPFEVGTVVLPEKFWRFPVDVQRRLALKALKVRGFLGGNLIYHPARYKSSFVDGKGKFHLAKWYIGCHFHFIGFFESNYDICRGCVHFNVWGSKKHGERSNHGGFACLNCRGFEGVTRRANFEDGFIVKVFDKRGADRLFNTASYELSHAGFAVGSKRVHISTWSGCCSCKTLKVEYVAEGVKCPECHSELVKAAPYLGAYEIVKSPDSPDYEKDSWMYLCESGKRMWFPLDDSMVESGSEDVPEGSDGPEFDSGDSG